ncbi:ArsR family transcriptional regulator [Sulfolobus sp. S-194]|uniref:winged helix-turn-helix domain-containing protein n=1 Tax=Sulfolobus sp. S-194 TaxID=2512240 RepID=UPI001436D74D|nr:winged helix-turn-helix domain-containing protein [Sulfolobus sp. S-194]QIW23579.1 ArsR family transcriptional regulator [Sulfolobus sp. S-194]
MDVFDAISNEVRRKILKTLQVPKSFSELLEELNIESPALAFHLKKLDGLISKDNEGKYTLTEEGKKALSIINMIESQNISLSSQAEIPMIIQYVDNFIVTENMIRKLKEMGRKLIIRDSNTVEFQDIDPNLLSDVLESIENVSTVKCPEELVNVISSKSKNVISIRTDEAQHTMPLTDLNLQPGKSTEREKEGLLSRFLSAIFPSIRINNRLRVVYDGPLQTFKDLTIELDGGIVTVFKGEPHLLAKCVDMGDLDINNNTIRADGCYLRISYPDLNSLKINVDGGKVSISEIKMNNLYVEIDGGIIDFNITVQNEVSVSIDGGKISGQISFLPSKESKLLLSVDGGIGDITLSLPDDISVISNSTINGGFVDLPMSRIGKNGVLYINASVDGGVIKIKENKKHET